MLMSRQVTAPVWAVSLRLRSWPTTGPRGGVGPATQTHVERHVVEQPEIGAAFADRQMLGQMPVGAQRAHAQLGDAVIVLDAGRLAERDEHVGAGIVGGRAVFLFLDGAPARQPAHRVAEPRFAPPVSTGAE